MTSSRDDDSCYYRTAMFSYMFYRIMFSLGLHTNTSLPLRWMAPEMLTSKKATSITDVYSFGITMVECFLLGALPFEELSNEKLVRHLLQQCKAGSGSTLAGVYGDKDNVSISNIPAVDSLLATCTHVQPQKRPRFADIVRDLRPGAWTVTLSPAILTSYMDVEGETSL